MTPSSQSNNPEIAKNSRRVRRSAGSGRILAAGTMLQDRYEILSVLGLGGMSTVYLARDRRFSSADKLCAIKEMAELVADHAAKKESLALFEREANTLASLNHPAIPKVYDFFSESNRAYLALEYIKGTDLEALVDASASGLAESDVVGWTIQICDVLTFLHTRNPDPLIFRDLKPSNVILDDMGRIILIDFGIAKVFQTEMKGTIVGTEGYAPPEQYKGVADPRTDIYALGATMHHLLTKSDPRYEIPFTFHERPPRKLNSRVSEAVEAVIVRALNYDMEKRFASAEEMKAALLTTRTAIVRSLQADSLPVQTPPSASREEGPQPLWEFACKDDIRATPLVYNDTVYIGSYDSVFYALDASSGELKWSLSAMAGICSTACVFRDAVVVGSEDSSVYALHSLTGRLLWSFWTGGPVRSSPRAGADVIFIGADDNFLYSLDGRTGRPVWRFATWRPIRSSPAVEYGAVYIGSDDEQVYAIATDTGAARWKYRANGAVISSPAVDDGLVVAASSDRSVYAFDALTGVVEWRTATGGKITSSPSIVEGSVLIGSADKSLYCLDLKSGRILWSYACGGPITSSPKPYGDRVYVGCVDGYLYCVELATGKLAWRFKTKGPIPGSAAFGEGVVYFGSMDSKLYALPT